MRALCIALIAIAGCHESKSEPQVATPSTSTTPAAEPGPATTAPAEPSPAATAPAGPAPAPLATPPPKPAKIKIVVRANARASVRWGKKVLGQTPLTVERPRDSGPIDLVLRAAGYFPVHTRVFTFRNDSIGVHLTKVENRMTLFGAKQEPAATPDGGVPAPTTPAPAATTPPGGTTPPGATPPPAPQPAATPQQPAPVPPPSQ
jgi:hypothetical protein